jgi:hypothetical protein
VRNLFAALLLFSFFSGAAQTRVSLATDLTVLYNFSPQQKFWAFGQTLQGNFHFTGKESAYAWVMYFTDGKFKNDYVANAKSPATVPATIQYTVNSTWDFRHMSLGWKHYFRGGFDIEEGWSLYGAAGFGLLFADVSNSYNFDVDTAQYVTDAPASGSGSFSKMTVDLAAGAEIPLGGGFSAYGEIRTWLPSSHDPSPYVVDNNNVPRLLMINAGIRILLGY